MSQQQIFISYSRKDTKWKDLLLAQLAVANQPPFFHVWHDSLLQGGDDWYKAIINAIDSGGIAILLVSAHSLSSKFIQQEEIPRILNLKSDNKTRLFPILVSQCAWQKVDWLQALNIRPEGGVPLESGTPADISEALTKIVLEISSLLKSQDILSDSRPSTQPIASQSPSSERTNNANIDNKMEFEFINRVEELNALCSGGAEPKIYIDAPAGFGKTYLLRKIAEVFSSEEHTNTDNDKGKKTTKGCAFIDLLRYRKNNSIMEIINDISLQVMSLSIVGKDYQEAGRQLRNGLGKMDSVALFFDSVERADDKTLQTLYEDLLPRLFKGVSAKQLRVVFAGRYLISRKENNDPRYKRYSPDWLGYTRKYLSPFTVETIKNFIIRRYEKSQGHLKGLIEAKLEEWCFFVWDMSGGHPQSIKKLVDLLESNNWTTDFDDKLERKYAYDECVKIDDVLDGVNDKGVIDDLKILSIFRVFGIDTIVYLIDKNVFANSRDAMFSILAPLISTGLVQRWRYSTRFSDAIVRRLVLSQMKTEDIERYKSLNEIAIGYYDYTIQKAIKSYEFDKYSDTVLEVPERIKEGIFHFCEVHDLSKHSGLVVSYLKTQVSYLKEVGYQTDQECRSLIESKIEEDVEIVQMFKSNLHNFDTAQVKDLIKELLDKVFPV